MSDDQKPQRPKAQPVRGMQDFLGEPAARFEHVAQTFRDVSRRFGFRRVEVPVVEFTHVFARTLGETTDVVSKEMYSFEDRNGESLTLRPEFTAGICRAYISEGWQQFAPLKLVTHGPLFRYERPQKGRYRQFHQIDAEVIGAAEPAADVELIAFADLLLKELGVQGVTLQLNTLGDAETRAAWRDGLVAHFSAHKDVLSEESRKRLETNPLRILDSKEAADRPLVEAAPAIDAYMSAEAGAFFEAVQKGLQASGVAFERQARLVRGFDYYRHTAFEFVSDALGSQATVIGGGRYDGLIEAMGGPHTPAVGWAGGIERLMMLCSEPAAADVEVALVPMGEAAELAANGLLAELRAAGFAAEQGWRGNMKKRMERAAKSGARFAVILGDSELEAGTVALKDMAAGTQRTVARADLLAVLQAAR
ncbi:histidine--tRNA ligase [Sandaracinobacter sp. RS1-74]|uniref:histidine--tRNA ligase n=1 Tax=Sandaracinobacteroides sayramensis TaxID=2913411 RepID=UPI001EDAE1CA|nr:histidine--tRNA ligase [Sandaracinobacteroides sayramensis]MCG2842190.1 histidine--tRNA ligase [Sandaracinobacteroides sayramensis]